MRPSQVNMSHDILHLELNVLVGHHTEEDRMRVAL